MNNSDDREQVDAIWRKTTVLDGIGGSPGVAVAPVLIVRPPVLDVPERRIAVSETETEWQRFEEARARTRQQLQQLRTRLDARARSGEAGILDAHLMVLDDDVMSARVRTEIVENQHNAERAVRDVANHFVKQFLQLEDPYMKERADDISDVGRRMIRNLLGITGTLTVRYLRPTRLGQLRAEARVDRVDGAKTYVVGHIADSDGATVEASGVFIRPRRR